MCLLFGCSASRIAPIPGEISTIAYERHRPEQTLLHEAVRENVETFLAKAREQGAPVAEFVEREIRAYLHCGILAPSGAKPWLEEHAAADFDQTPTWDEWS